MPPKSSSSTLSINSNQSLRQAFHDLALSLNLPQHQGAFAIDVVAGYKDSMPELSKAYEQMFGENRTDLTTVSQKALEGKYTLTTLEHQQQQNENDNGEEQQQQQPLASRVKSAINLFLADCRLIQENCAKFNGDQNNLPQLAAEMVELAKTKTTTLERRLMNSTFLNKARTSSSVASSSTTTANNSVARGSGAGVVEIPSSRIRQRTNDEQQQQQQRDVAAMTKIPATAATPTTNTNNNTAFPSIKHQQQQNQPLTEEEVKHALENRIRQIAESYKNHPLANGPLAIKEIPIKIRERIIAQHLAFHEKCKVSGSSSSLNRQQHQQHHHHSSSVALSSIPSSSSSSSQQQQQQSSSIVKKQDLVISVLLDFFSSFCAKSLNVSEDELKQKKYLLTSREDLIQALENSEITNPRNFLQNNSNNNSGDKKSNNSSKQKSATTDSSSLLLPPPSRKIEQYWAVLSRVVLPYFNQMSMSKFVYPEEKVAAYSRLLKIQLLMKMKETGSSSSSSSSTSNNNNNNNCGGVYWHKILHFDVLVRSLLEMNNVVKVILQDTLDRCGSYNINNSAKMMNNNNNTSNNSNNEAVAMNIVSSAVVPVVNELLDYIAEQKL